MPHIPMPSAAWRLMLAIQCEQQEGRQTDCVPTDDKLLEDQGDTPYYYAHLGHTLAGAGSLIPSTN
jgi:hypothetical protein